MPTFAYNGLEQADVAYLTANGIHYRCYVWLDKRDGDSITVEAACFAEQPDGQEVEVFRNRVRTPTTGLECDCPKIVTSLDGSNDDAFLVFWLEGDRTSGAPDIRYSAYTMSDLITPGWTAPGTIATSADWMYDVQHVQGVANQCVLVHRINATQFELRRFSDVLVVADWTRLVTIDCAARILAVAAHSGDDNVVFCFERDQAGAAPYRVDCVTTTLSTGGAGATWNALGTRGVWTQAGFARTSSERWLLVAECVPGSGSPTFAPTWNAEATAIVRCRQNTNTGATDGAEHITPNLRMLSRPWSWANSRTSATTSNVYGIVGFSEVAHSDYRQSAAWVVNFDAPEIGSGVTSQHRLRPIGNINLRLVDARISGASPAGGTAGFPGGVTGASNGRRLNHISNASEPAGLGPFRKAKTMALVSYSRLISVGDPILGDSLIPAATDVVGHRAIMEEPWAYERDPVETALSANVKVTWAWQQLAPVELGDMLAILGGAPSIYDGHRVIDIGYPWTPEIAALTEVIDSNLVQNDTYAWTAVYEWRDTQGHVHRSAPCTPRELTIVAATAGAELRIVTQTLTAKLDDFHFSETTPISIVVYRTAANGAIFYRLHGEPATAGDAQHEIQNTPQNDPDVFYLDIGDALTDALLTDNDVLPWQFLNGAWVPLVPVQPPAASVGCVWRNRLWLVPNDAPTSLWYSLEIRPGPGTVALAAPEFSAVNVFRLDADPFLVTALMPMDDMLVVFARDAVYSLAGSLNDDTGAGQNLDMQALTRGVGCLSQRSVVRSPVGIFFQSERGIHLMDRSGGFDNVSLGSLVEDDVESGGNILAAALFEQDQQVIFVTNGSGIDGEPRLLVYDYHHKLWTRHTLPLADLDGIGGGEDRLCNALDIVPWRGADGETLKAVLEQGALLIERPKSEAEATRFFDQRRSGSGSTNTAAYNRIDVQTGWISIAGVANWKRIKSIGLLTSGQSAATDPDLQVTLDYDLDGDYTPTLTDTWSQESDYVPYVRVRPSVRKLAAVRLRLRDSGTFSTLPDWSISSATLEVGIKKGLRRVPDTQIAS